MPQCLTTYQTSLLPNTDTVSPMPSHVTALTCYQNASEALISTLPECCQCPLSERSDDRYNAKACLCLLLYISPCSLYNDYVRLQDSAPHGWCVILFQVSSHITNYSNEFSATRLSSYIAALYTQLRNAHSRTALKNKQPAPASTNLLEPKHGLAVIQHVVPLPPATCESSSLWQNP